MSARTLSDARRDPAAWRRHGLTPPWEVDALVLERTAAPHAPEPRYSDFFVRPTP
ncbi:MULTISPECIES: hypothetical protein [unclassified Curtobacterium]|uniref:hypothetical protein n=1 Tax=unclassified Curtobacterium TaxID=257496 RepID=UPI00226B8880|nr:MULTISPECIES: hypothetical protein [unclassified Curtobacterium]